MFKLTNPVLTYVKPTAKSAVDSSLLVSSVSQSDYEADGSLSEQKQYKRKNQQSLEAGTKRIKNSNNGININTMELRWL